LENHGIGLLTVASAVMQIFSPTAHSRAFLLLIMLVFLLLAGFHLAYTYEQASTYLEQDNRENNQVENKVVREALNFYLAQLRDKLDMFTQTHWAQIRPLLDNSDQPQLEATLLKQLRQFFPGVRSFTVADAGGHALLEDFQGLIGPACEKDLAAFARQPSAPVMRLHPNALFPHIDIMSVFTEPERGEFVFFINYPAEFIPRILSALKFHDIGMLLINRAVPGRIEFTDRGYRHGYERPWDLDEAALAVLPFQDQHPVPGSQWDLVTYTPPTKLAQDAEQLHKLMLLNMLAVGAVGLLVFPSLYIYIKKTSVLQERLHYAAEHDDLTGLENRSQFISRLSFTLALAERKGFSVAVLFIDLDRFKPVNDVYGHEAGDAVLEEVGRRLRDGRRGSDIVARFGGDEFLIALPDFGTEKDLHQIIDQIRHSIEQPITVGASHIEISASIGFAIHRPGTPPTEQAINALLNQADKNMYREKAARVG